MPDQGWVRSGAAPWLVATRPEGATTVAGITFAAGLLHQPTARLGVAPLLGAWLGTRLNLVQTGLRALNRPAADPRPGDEARVTVRSGPLETSLVATGGPTAVAAVLEQVDEVLAAAGTVEVGQVLRDRARLHPNPLAGWLHHLTARWPAYPPFLAALGPLALRTLDAAALAEHAALLAAAPRVYWTNEPALAERIRTPRPGVAPPLAAPGRISDTAPKRLPRRAATELFSTITADSMSAELGLAVLIRALRRRLVDFEPLAATVRVSAAAVGAELQLVYTEADLVAGRDEAALTAVTETLEDLAGRPPAAAEVARTRALLAGAQRAAPPHEYGTLHAMAQRHLRHGDFPTPQRLAAEIEQADDAAVGAVLATAYERLVTAGPDPEPAARPATGRRFVDRFVPTRQVRCSAERVGVVARRPVKGRYVSTMKQVTTSSVDFDEVVLRVDAGDQQCTLIDHRLGSLPLVWAGYRRGDALRGLVAARTRHVPVVEQGDDPDWPQRLAAAERRLRRRWIRAAVAMGVFVALFALVIGWAVLDGRHSGGKTIALDHPTTVTFENGTTLTPSPPEVIERGPMVGPDAQYLGVQLRMCGGRSEAAGSRYSGLANSGRAPRNYFGPTQYQLLAGEWTLPTMTGLADRPPPPAAYLEPGECRTGWLVYRLAAVRTGAGPTRIPVDGPLTLRYRNIEDDQVTWKLPAPAQPQPPR